MTSNGFDNARSLYLAIAAAFLLVGFSGCKTDVGRAVDQVEEYVESCEDLTEALDEVTGYHFRGNDIVND